MRSEVPSIQSSTCTILIVPGHSVGYPMSAIIRNPGPGTVYLGGDGVTSATGFPLATDESLEIDVVNEKLYAVATTPTTIYILRRGD